MADLNVEAPAEYHNNVIFVEKTQPKRKRQARKIKIEQKKHK